MSRLLVAGFRHAFYRKPTAWKSALPDEARSRQSGVSGAGPTHLAAAHLETARPLTARPDPHLVTLTKPRSYEAERYWTVRHALENRRPEGRVSVIAVSSPATSEGKTTTAINLAGAMAHSGKARVLLIDADLRRPSVPAQLGIDAQRLEGVSDLLEEANLPFERLVRSLPAYNLHLLPAGTRAEVPGDALGSARAGAVIEQARRLYDSVVIDTPPLLAVPDCRLLEKWVDGFVIVVTANQTPRSLLEEALDLVSPDKVVGIILNKDDRWLSGYGAYYRRYYEARAGMDHHAG